MHDDHPEIACALDDLEDIIRCPADGPMSFGERAGAYAALCERTSFLRERLEGQDLLSSYGSQKLLEVWIHGGGMFGFGERRARDPKQERVSAVGSLLVLRGLLRDSLGSER